MNVVNNFFVSLFLYINPLLLAIAITGSPSPSEVNQRGCSKYQPLEGPQGTLKYPRSTRGEKIICVHPIH